MKRNLVIRIVAIVLCALMVLSAVAVALTAFAADTTMLAASPETGSSNIGVIIAVAVVVALLAIAACIIIPLAKKKK